MERRLENALTVDVEDYFHVTAFEKHIKREDWELYPLRVEDNTLRVLDMLDEFPVKATFFVLGWVAERVPSLVKEIHRRGHEIACHGYDHRLIYHMEATSFRDDIRKTKLLLEDICGDKIYGYRAPSYSITKKSMWALDVLIEEGFLYDSSIFPIIHDTYGMSGAHRFPHVIERPSGTIREFPLSTMEFSIVGAKIRMPVAGGGYLRLFPLRFIKKAIAHINTQEGQPAVIYFHPWEIDAAQPRIKVSLKSRIRHYVNLDIAEQKIKMLLSSFRFSHIMNLLKKG